MQLRRIRNIKKKRQYILYYKYRKKSRCILNFFEIFEVFSETDFHMNIHGKGTQYKSDIFANTLKGSNG